jgi:hypothetical protein
MGAATLVIFKGAVFDVLLKLYRVVECSCHAPDNETFMKTLASLLLCAAAAFTTPAPSPAQQPFSMTITTENDLMTFSFYVRLSRQQKRPGTCL